jgi:putative ATP-dependent endonuclease of the OLD family
MKILKFAVNNYKGITGGLEKNVIDFASSNSIFIFGQNNVGKSTFLKAYEAFYDDKVVPDDFTYEKKLDIVVEMSLEVTEGGDKEAINKGTGNKFDNLKTKYLDASGTLMLRKTWRASDNGKVSINETYNVQTSSWESISYGGIGLHPAFQALILKPLFIKAMPNEDQVEKIVNEILREAATRKLSDKDSLELKDAEATITRLQEKVYSKADINAYKEKVNERFKTLFSSYEIDIDDGTSKAKYTHDKIGMDFKIDFKRTDNSQPSSYLQMGHGAVRMAIFLLMLMRDELREKGTVEKNFLVLFEEPELFLHPNLTKKLRKLIYEVSDNNMPFQVLCASHSPQMIDIRKDHTSLVRMTKGVDGDTSLYQIVKDDLKNPEQETKADVKQKIYELLRIDPFVCESFYADEVILVEGDTEAILLRGYEQEFGLNNKDIFVVNCHSSANIPFYQKIFSKFNIKYSVICDTDHFIAKKGDTPGTNRTGWDGKTENPKFTSHIQKSIMDQFEEDLEIGLARHFFVFPETFEPCHEKLNTPFKFDDRGASKAVKADKYWKQILENKSDKALDDVPIISYIKSIIS